MKKDKLVARIVQGDLEIYSVETASILFKGKVNSLDVEEVFSIPRSKDFIVRLNYLQAAEKSCQNLVRINRFGKLIWAVSKNSLQIGYGPNRDNDYYVKINEVGSSIIAITYLGYVDTITLNIGKITNSIWVK